MATRHPTSAIFSAAGGKHPPRGAPPVKANLRRGTWGNTTMEVYSRPGRPLEAHEASLAHLEDGAPELVDADLLPGHGVPVDPDAVLGEQAARLGAGLGETELSEQRAAGRPCRRRSRRAGCPASTGSPRARLLLELAIELGFGLGGCIGAVVQRDHCPRAISRLAAPAPGPPAVAAFSTSWMRSSSKSVARPRTGPPGRRRCSSPCRTCRRVGRGC